MKCQPIRPIVKPKQPFRPTFKSSGRPIPGAMVKDLFKLYTTKEKQHA